MPKLYSQHPRSMAAAYANLETQAETQGKVRLGTPGTVLERKNAAGFLFYSHQWRDLGKAQRESYLAGPVGNKDADLAAEHVRAEIRDAREALDASRLLIREGYFALDDKAFAVIAAVHNRGLFKAGAVLVGTRAFEAIMNKMGLRAASFSTEDVDFAREGELAITPEQVPEGGFFEIVRESGIDFLKVPPFGNAQLSAKFKERGNSKFTVDLLVPSDNDEYEVLQVPELKAGATALPYLRYLIAKSQPATVLSRLGCMAVRTPLPERFAIHKLIVAQLRTGRQEKARKDKEQAAILLAGLWDLYPGAIEAAVESLPRSAVRYVKASLQSMGETLSSYPAIVDAVVEMADKGLANARPKNRARGKSR